MSRPVEPAEDTEYDEEEMEEDEIEKDSLGHQIPEFLRDKGRRSNEPKRVKGDKEKTAFENIRRMRGYQLSDGQGKNGDTYTRRIQFGPGGKELLHLAAGLNKSMKMINGTQTKAGAVKWVKRNRPNKNWEVIEADITGPNGKPDGIEEVVVYDGKGNVRIVNGYSLGASKFPWRAAYYTTYPTKLEQRRHPFQEFKRLYMKTAATPDSQGNYTYTKPLPQKYSGIRRVITPMQQFRNIFFTPTYKLFTDEIKVKNFDASSIYQDVVFAACFANRKNIHPGNDYGQSRNKSPCRVDKSVTFSKSVARTIIQVYKGQK